MWKEVLNFSLKNGGTLTATQANIWQGSLTIEQSVSADDTFELGSTHIGQMTVTLADLQVSQIQDATFSLSTEGHLILDGERVPYQTVYANVDFTDAVVVVYMAQDDDTLTQMGVYNVVQTTRDDGIISITAYDNMDKLSEVYTTALTFPSTYGAMANEITGQLLTFDGSSTAVAEKPEAEDLTKREVLGYIAQACGYNVLCNPQGYFQFVRYNLSGFSTQGQYHEISGLYSFHHSQYPVVITGVKVIVTDEEMTTDPDTGDTVAEIVTHEYTAGTDAYQLVIEENPLITTTNGQSVADALYALYGNVEFYTGDVSHLSDLSIKASDIMKVTDRHNNTFPMLVSRTVISTGSAQATSSYAEEPSRKITVQPSQMSRIQNSVKQAAVEAKNGKRIASNTNQYFWHTETGSDTGAHITEIPREDFLADPENGGGNTLIRSNGVAIRNGLDELATFSATGAAIGKTDDTHLEMVFNRISITDKDGVSFFDVKDLRGESGYAEVTETFYPKDVVELDGRYIIQLSFWAANRTYTVTPSASDITVLGRGGNNVYISRALNTGETVTATYPTESDEIKSFTLGKRHTSFDEGAHSYALGYEVAASGLYSLAAGNASKANGKTSTATGHSAIANGEASMANNFQTVASGFASATFGQGTDANGDCQTAIGKFNRIDYNNDFAFIVGNGSTPTARSNAFAVGWDGSVTAWGVKSYTPTWETGEEAVASHCVVSAGVCSLSYQGQIKTHSTNTLLGTLPVGARPLTAVFCPFVKAGVAYGTIRIEATGEIYVGFISSTTASNRIYFNCSFPVV